MPPCLTINTHFLGDNLVHRRAGVRLILINPLASLGTGLPKKLSPRTEASAEQSKGIYYRSILRPRWKRSTQVDLDGDYSVPIPIPALPHHLGLGSPSHPLQVTEHPTQEPSPSKQSPINERSLF